MAHTLHLIRNYIDNYTLTATTAATNCPATNLANPLQARVWRSTALTAQEIKGTASGTYAVGGVAFNGHNLTTGATIQVIGYSDAAWSTITYTGATASPATNAPFYQEFFTESAVRSFKIVLNDGANTDGYLEIESLYVGADFNPITGAEGPPSITWNQASPVNYSLIGSPLFESTTAWRETQINLPYLTQAEGIILAGFARAWQQGAVAWICMDDTLTSEALLLTTGALVMQSPPRVNFGGGFATAQIVGRII